MTLRLVTSSFAFLLIMGNCYADSPAKSSDGKQSPSPALVSGIDQNLISDNVKPGDDFYLYSNEKWLSETKIPADKSDYGIFTVLDDQTQEQVRELIESVAADSSAAKVAPRKK